ncbi:hypothetical protein F971_00159 [Acinetobacter vivianii]|uniref:Uncharacterized protein n=1 Tax=Acinetobacter vivianii TaxID=1776742 RepID=N8WG89_9GAMM|nr:hypothetical protein F971_00159 [Acinetobacter vivianii]
MVSVLLSVDWSADKTDYPREVCEHVLAHKLPYDYS